MYTVYTGSAPMQPRPWPAAAPTPAQPNRFRRGEVIAVDDDLHRHPYQVLSGEIVILRQGRPIDLIEPGEWLDGWSWPGTIAVAWSNVVLASGG